MKQMSGLVLLIALPIASLCQKKTVVVMGSSTAYGVGASPIDSSWANLSRFYWDSLGVLDTLYNIADPGTTSYVGMPTGFVPPGFYNTPTNQVDTAHNITKAMSLNPDVVIIGYPSNDIAADIPVANFMSNLRTMYNIVTGAGKICYITTTEPRDDLDQGQQLLLETSKDSIELEFGQYSLDFYDIVADPSDSLAYNPVLTPDGTHPNNAGHRLLFDYVSANVSLGIPLPLVLLNFSAVPRGTVIQTSWTVTGESSAPQFEVEKSPDGKTFTTAFRESGKGAGGATYTWTDDHPLSGNNFYRLALLQDGSTTYSPVVLVFLRPGRLIGNIYVQSGSTLQAQINTGTNTNVSIAVFAATGDLIARESSFVSQASSLISISLPAAAAGVYYLRVQTADGQAETRPFIKL